VPSYPHSGDRSGGGDSTQYPAILPVYFESDLALGTHPHADQSIHRSGGSLSGHVNPRCRDRGRSRVLAEAYVDERKGLSAGRNHSVMIMTGV
jgi:hypothetical protein